MEIEWKYRATARPVNYLLQSSMDDGALRSEQPTIEPGGLALAPFGWGRTALVFGGAAALLWLATRVLLPAIQSATGWEPLVVWFVAGGLGFFLPLALLGLAMIGAERRPNGVRLWQDRLWFHGMNRGDWLWGLAGLGLVYALCGGSMLALRVVHGSLAIHPPFLETEPLSAGRWWILAAWIPFFLINILGEELLWHGVLLPRQKVALGRHAALASGLGWLGMHAAFGLPILLTLWPATFIIPYVVQRRRNTWLGVLIHAGLNGPGFLTVALGLV